MPDIREQSLLYHLTSMKNLESILRCGLKPRAQITNFEDVADQEIIASRKGHELDAYVPFHWFAKNPFDGRVQADRRNERFVLITARRTIAQQNWKVIPRHPLSGDIEILDYAAGFAAIDWPLLNTRDYSDQDCKCVCMAECLSPAIVMPDKFFKLFVKTSADHDEIWRLMLLHKVFVGVQVNPNMFI